METKPDVAYKNIKDKIIDNTFKPKQRLVESQLSKDMNTSRNAIRQALLRLEQENLVVIEKNVGAYIKFLSLEEVRNILEIRGLLESLIAVSAVEHISDDELNELEAILNNMGQCIEEKRYDDYTNGNNRFHDVIYKASKKNEAVDLVKMIKTQLVRHQFKTILISDRNLKSVGEHWDIFNALKERDKEKVDKVVKIHIGNVAKAIDEYYDFL